MSLPHLPRERLDLSRILIYGVTGSGKTTLATQLSQKLGLPFRSVDDLAWEPGWKMKSDEDQLVLFNQLCAQEQWILDSAYSTWLDIASSRATLIIALDYPRWFSFGRLTLRTIRRAIDKKPVCNGNIESWRMIFSRQSILIWHFKTYHSKRRRAQEWVLSGRPVLVMKSPKQTMAWLSTLSLPDEMG